MNKLFGLFLGISLIVSPVAVFAQTQQEEQVRQILIQSLLQVIALLQQQIQIILDLQAQQGIGSPAPIQAHDALPIIHGCTAEPILDVIASTGIKSGTEGTHYVGDPSMRFEVIYDMGCDLDKTKVPFSWQIESGGKIVHTGETGATIQNLYKWFAIGTTWDRETETYRKWKYVSPELDITPPAILIVKVGTKTHVTKIDE